jgi:hypothetical protein
MASYTASALAAAEQAGMTPADYRTWVRSLRARGGIVLAGRLDDFGPMETEANEGNYKRPGKPVAPGDGLSPAEREARTAAWLSQLGRKVEVSDITHTNKRAAQAWARSYRGELQFVKEVAGKRFSDPMAKGVLNCWRAELLRPSAPAQPVARPVAAEIPEEMAALLP